MLVSVNKWARQSGIRALYTMVDALIGVLILESAGLFALDGSVTLMMVLGAGVTCFLRSVLRALQAKKEGFEDEF